MDTRRGRPRKERLERLTEQEAKVAVEKETVEPVAQEQTMLVHDANEHIQPPPTTISAPTTKKEANLPHYHTEKYFASPFASSIRMSVLKRGKEGKMAVNFLCLPVFGVIFMSK